VSGFFQFYLSMAALTALTVWWADKPRRAGEWVAFFSLAVGWPFMVAYLVYYLVGGKK
jgi:hypothetical protein